MLNDSSCAPAHNTPLPLERSPPDSFKRMLGSARFSLPRRTLRRTVGAENATLTRSWRDHGVTLWAFPKVDACILRHRLLLLVPTARARNRRVEIGKSH